FSGTPGSGGAGGNAHGGAAFGGNGGEGGWAISFGNGAPGGNGGAATGDPATHGAGGAGGRSGLGTAGPNGVSSRTLQVGNVWVTIQAPASVRFPSSAPRFPS
ncbi:MAG TPA: hypothetical protein PK331_06825, partial [Gordonia sp. (in: high G+C Gram-positive bacteria)]|nr:hypothetical protein [Gordonia sp. (in: high G+C Gram-positive bacteria)]